MARYLLLTHYRGAPAAVNDAARLARTGEFVDGQALSAEGVWVRSDGEGRPPVTDGVVRRDEGPDEPPGSEHLGSFPVPGAPCSGQKPGPAVSPIRPGRGYPVGTVGAFLIR